MKKSKWFDGAKFIPAHVGCYEVKVGKGFLCSYWNGSFWCVQCWIHEQAEFYKNSKSAFQSPTWRGIKK